MNTDCGEDEYMETSSQSDIVTAHDAILEQEVKIEEQQSQPQQPSLRADRSEEMPDAPAYIPELPENRGDLASTAFSTATPNPALDPLRSSEGSSEAAAPALAAQRKRPGRAARIPRQPQPGSGFYAELEREMVDAFEED